MLFADHIMHHYFTRMDAKTLCVLVFVWMRRHPVYCQVSYDFYLLSNSRLWPVCTAFDLLDGRKACMDVDIDGLFWDMFYGLIWPVRHLEYFRCEYRILETI